MNYGSPAPFLKRYPKLGKEKTAIIKRISLLEKNLADTKTLIDFGTLLGGGLIGFLSATLKEWLLENKKLKAKNNELKRKNLEELYVLLSHWKNIFSSKGLNLLSVMLNELDYNQHLDLIIESGEKRNVDFMRIEMIINIYAPELNDGYQNILKSRDTLSDIADQHELKYKDGYLDGREFIKPYKKSLLELTRYIEILQKKLVLLIKKSKT